MKLAQLIENDLREKDIIEDQDIVSMTKHFNAITHECEVLIAILSKMAHQKLLRLRPVSSVDSGNFFNSEKKAVFQWMDDNASEQVALLYNFKGPNVEHRATKIAKNLNYIFRQQKRFLQIRKELFNQKSNENN